MPHKEIGKLLQNRSWRVSSHMRKIERIFQTKESGNEFLLETISQEKFLVYESHCESPHQTKSQQERHFSSPIDTFQTRKPGPLIHLQRITGILGIKICLYCASVDRHSEHWFGRQTHQLIPDQSARSEDKGFKERHLGSWVRGPGVKW